MKNGGRTVLMVAMFLFVGAMQSVLAQEPKVSSEQKEPSAAKAIALLYPTKDSSVHGTVVFSQVAGGVRIVADVEGLSPGKHGFHIHDYGDCSAPDGTSAGGHFNPEHAMHGAPMADMRHVGDLGNLIADQDGHAHLEWTDAMMTFSGAHSIIGRSVIVHANEDDLKSQPVGNAGARVACGVIGLAKPEAPK